MSHKVFIFLLLLTGSFLQATAQNKLGFSGELGVTGYFSSDNELPFWMYSNTQAEVGAATDFSSLASVTANYRVTEESSFEAGFSGFFRNGVEEKFQRRELYVQFKNSWLKATAGAKSPEDKSDGLSVSNQNFLLSRNARPFPGVLLESPDSLKVAKNLFVEYGLGHFVLNDDRYVDNTWVHYKRAGIHFVFNETNILSGRIQHYAQWAGTSPEYGDLPDNLSAFWDVFLAKRSSTDVNLNENANALGNHLGSYFLGYAYENDFKLRIYHDHPFEDGSGTALANFPDGIWGVAFQPKQNKIFSKILYEFVTTKNQSKGTAAGRDNYFNNGIYRSGWSYDQQIIGIPFFTYDPTPILSEDTPLPVASNAVVAHHIGVMGFVGNFEWKAILSYVSNYGKASNPFPESNDLFYSYGNVTYTSKNFGILSLEIAFDYSDTSGKVWAAGLGYRYKF